MGDARCSDFMADILFAHSYFLRFDPKEFRAMMPYPPLGTLYAASLAREHGYTVALFDSMLAGGVQEFGNALSRFHPKVVVIYDDDFNYLTKMCLSRMREAAFAMSAMARQAGCTVIVHGSDPVDHLEEYFAHDADFALCGEGERTLIETLNTIFGRRGNPESIPGLAFLQAGRIRRNPAREVLHDLDALPFPSRDLIDVELYRRVWMRQHGFFSINMVTTRGCPFHCNWCAKPLYGQVYHSRTPDNVVREMRIVKETIRPDHLWFCDDIFGLKPGWIAEFADEVEKQDARIPFKCLARVDLLLKGDTVAHLRRSGCTSVWVGAESGSQKILDGMEKGTTVAQIYEATRRLKENGIRVGFFLQFGYPGESREDIALTWKMVKECRPDEIGISVSYPLPGTRFYENVRAQLGEKHNWRDSQDLDLLVQGTFAPEFYRTLHTATHKRFRLWQGLDILRESVSRPWKVTPWKIRRVAAAAYHWLTLPSVEAELKRLEQCPPCRKDEPSLILNSTESLLAGNSS